MVKGEWFTMKYKMMCVLLAGVIALGSLGGCSNTGKKTNEQSEQVSNSQQTGGAISSSIVDGAKVDLTHTYITRFGEVNQITYPDFSFAYPDGWEITSEEVTQTSEEVILTNDTGVTVTYWNFSGMRDLTGPTRDMNRVDVTKVASASFIPGYVQATDYSDLGTFIVGKLKTVGQYDMLGGGEYQETADGGVRYALLPESEVGEQEECIIVGLPTFSFWYGSHISLIANSPSGEFTKQEEKEVVAILSSFRDNSVSSESTDVSSTSTDTNTAATIDELWDILTGTWVFVEVDFDGYTETVEDKPSYEHTMELRYTDGQPCMSRYTQVENHSYPDLIYYDFAAVDEKHYNVYLYKRGSYGDDYGNWSEDVKLVWYNFDLSNLEDGKLVIKYYISWDNGYLDERTYVYSRD